MTRAMFCNTRVGRVRLLVGFGHPTNADYLLEHDNGDREWLTDAQFRAPLTIGDDTVELEKLVAFAGGWRTI